MCIAGFCINVSFNEYIIPVPLLLNLSHLFVYDFMFLRDSANLPHHPHLISPLFAFLVAHVPYINADIFLSHTIPLHFFIFADAALTLCPFPSITVPEVVHLFQFFPRYFHRLSMFLFRLFKPTFHPLCVWSSDTHCLLFQRQGPYASGNLP